MRYICLLPAILVLMASAGCSQQAQPPTGVSWAGEQRCPVSNGPVLRHPSLMFDRIPGSPTATAFAYRSDWPSTSTSLQQPQVLYYVTYLNDRQGYGWYGSNYVYRRARYYQVGVIER
jgi:hypothetical protein